MDLTERILLAILVAIIVLVSGAQSYKAGERNQANEDSKFVIRAIRAGYKNGFNACQDQF